MLPKYLLYCVFGVGVLFTPIVSAAQEHCTPITRDNAVSLALFLAVEGFTEYYFPGSGFGRLVDNETLLSRIDAPDYIIVGSNETDDIPVSFFHYDHKLELYHAVTGDFINQLDTNSDAITELTISSDGRLVAFGDAESIIQVWDVITGERLLNLAGHQQGTPVDALAFNADGTLLASGAMDNQVFLWDIATGTMLHDFSAYDDHVTDVEFSPDGATLAIALRHSVALVKVASLDDHILETSVAGSVFRVAFSPDSGLLAIVGVIDPVNESYYGEIWDVSTQASLMKWNFDQPFYGIDFTTDGCFLVATGYDDANLMQMWRVE